MGSSAPADILAALRPMPTKEQWEEEELHQYGTDDASDDDVLLVMMKSDGRNDDA